MAAIVLAGGKGLRLGQDKPSLIIGKESLMQRVLNRLAQVSSDIIVAVSQSQAGIILPPGLPLRTVIDLYPGTGSLGGIYTGLTAAKEHHSLVVACDMPFLNVALLRYMINLAPPFDVVVPRVGGKLEPLHAVYSKNCLAPIESLIKENDLKIAHFFFSVRVRYIEEAETDTFDPRHLSLFNINTQSDLKRARALAEQRSSEED